MTDERELDAIEERLRAKLAEADAQIAELTKPPEGTGEISFGKRVGEGTSQAIDRFTDIGIANEVQGIKERVERTLTKLEEGTYGTCDSCGGAIAPGRLNAAPESVLCIECARNAR